MIRALTPSAMKHVEEEFAHRSGLPTLVLMENAAAAVAKHIAIYKNALIIAGPGNNGGDGMAIARLYAAIGGNPLVCVCAEPNKYVGDARLQYDALRNLDIPTVIARTRDDLQLSFKPDVIIDALFGIGLNREVEGFAKDVIDYINNSSSRVVSVDVPSGMNAATGEGYAVHADETITFHAPKVGHFVYPGRENTGRLIVAPIGILEREGAVADSAAILDAADATLPARPAVCHKNMFGHALIVAGSLGMAGAAAFAATAALRVGAGLVTVACPPDIIPIVQTLAPHATAVPLTDAASLAEALAGKTCAAIGPGLAATPFDVLSPLYDLNIPQVWDASALRMLATNQRKPPRRSVVTPHPGEANALLGHAVTSDVIASAKELASVTGAVALLKGASTIICDDKHNVTINTTGCPAMAKGGSGDILTGVIAGLLAQGLEPYEAARVGAYLHGAAGEAAQLSFGVRGVMPSNIIDNL